MTNILITGGSGFIGSHLIDRLRKDSSHVITVFDLYPPTYQSWETGLTFIQGNVENTALLRRTLVDHGIENVFHLAWADIHETSIQDPLNDIRSNLISSLLLLESCRKAKVKRIVFLSSGGTVYGIPSSMPIAETHPTNPISAYGITKLAVEKYLKMYFHLYGIDYVIFRPSVPYGPRQNPRRRQGAVSVFIYRMLRDETISIWGDGKVTRDFFYVGDLINALEKSIQLESPAHAVINIGGGEGVSLNDLLEIIEATLDRKARVNYETPRNFDVPNLELDIRRAKELLNWEPTVILSEGIKKTVAWQENWMDHLG